MARRSLFGLFLANIAVVGAVPASPPVGMEAQARPAAQSGLYAESLNLFVSSPNHPEFDGMPIVPCNPKPFVDYPHINVDPKEQKLGADVLQLLPWAIQQYRAMLFLCANNTAPDSVTPNFSIAFSTKEFEDERPSAGTSKQIGYLSSPVLGGVWDGDAGIVSIGANNTVYAWAPTPEGSRLGSPKYDFFLCDQPSRGKIIRVLQQTNLALTQAKSPWSFPVNNCTAIGVRRQTIRVLPASTVTSTFAPGISLLDPVSSTLSIENLYGGQDFEYYPWLRNLSIITEREKKAKQKARPEMPEVMWAPGFGPNA